MFIHELLPESEATLTCQVGKDKRCFPTKVVGPYKEEKTILVEPIRHNGMVVNFNIDDMLLETQVEKNKAIVFPVKQTKNISVKGQTYLLIESEIDASAANRRSVVRVPLGVPCVLKYGPRRTEIDCYVHDISVTGISFTIKTKAEITRGDELNCSFVYGEDRTVFRIFATTVRVQQNKDTGYLTVGAKLKSTSKELEKFIMELQREEAQRRRGK